MKIKKSVMNFSKGPGLLCGARSWIYTPRFSRLPVVGLDKTLSLNWLAAMLGTNERGVQDPGLTDGKVSRLTPAPEESKSR